LGGCADPCQIAVRAAPERRGLCRRTEDIEEAAESFAGYGHLQKYLRWREVEFYHALTKRAGPEAQARVDQTDRLARTFFAPFWETKKGRGRWRETWSSKKVWDLCTLSVNPMRPHQYRLLYGRGSEFTHSSPVAVFAAMHLTDEPEELARLAELTDAREEKELREVGGMASVFLFELACLIGDRLPDFDPPGAGKRRAGTHREDPRRAGALPAQATRRRHR
jgi:hypothetical protein